MHRTLLFAAALSLAATAASAATLSFSGSISRDDEVVLLPFTVDAAAFVDLRTYSYAGGTLADGTVVAAGGFDPVLTLFDASGLYIRDEFATASLPPDPATGLSYDVLLSLPLLAGDYILAVTQFYNLSVGDQADGFTETGNPTFTVAFGCSNGLFCDDAGNNRTGTWALDIVITPGPAAPVPLPASLPLLGGAVAGLGLLRRRRG